MGDRRLFRRSATPSDDQMPSEIVAEELPPLEEDDLADENCARALFTIEGVISEVALSSRGDAPALEAFIRPADGDSAEDAPLVLVWLGRTEIAGIHPGREVVATARICSEGGARVMYNPRYDLR